MLRRSKLASIAFIMYWAMFGVYYTSGIAFSSFWQIWCKTGVNLCLMLLSMYAHANVCDRFDRLISTTAISFFAGMSVFYILSFLLFNFFELAINNYVGYCFLGLFAASLITSFIFIYGRKK